MGKLVCDDKFVYVKYGIVFFIEDINCISCVDDDVVIVCYIVIYDIY